MSDYAKPVGPDSPASINRSNVSKWRTKDANVAEEARKKFDKFMEQEEKEPEHQHDSDECPHCHKKLR